MTGISRTPHASRRTRGDGAPPTWHARAPPPPTLAAPPRKPAHKQHASSERDAAIAAFAFGVWKGMLCSRLFLPRVPPSACRAVGRLVPWLAAVVARGVSRRQLAVRREVARLAAVEAAPPRSAAVAPARLARFDLAAGVIGAEPLQVADLAADAAFARLRRLGWAVPRIVAELPARPTGPCRGREPRVVDDFDRHDRPVRVASELEVALARRHARCWSRAKKEF
mmetsp:Transcript_50160/g.162125  ORF Transcript_50160/g.162125 Transcript_50160/m.162125 type:complete len:225 (-) Transcript_50160:184-858(-)